MTTAQAVGAAVVILGTMNADRLVQARSFGCDTVDQTSNAPLGNMIEHIVGEPEANAAIDTVTGSRHGHGAKARDASASSTTS